MNATFGGARLGHSVSLHGHGSSLHGHTSHHGTARRLTLEEDVRTQPIDMTELLTTQDVLFG